MWGDAALIIAPLVFVTYIVARVLMSRTSGASETSWRDITVIDVAIVLAVGAFLIR